MSIPHPLPELTLHGRLVDLVPLSREHLGPLQEAVSDGQIWDRWYTSVPRPEDMAAEIDRRLALREAGTMLPFTTIRRADGRALGMTTFMDIDATVPRVEVGSTWNRASAHRTGTNADSKLLLLAHAFEQWQVEAVRFRTHRANQQSRTAIERLGAELEGILRADSRDRFGIVRDTAQYSLLARDWPMARAMLEHRLSRHPG